MSGVVPMPFRLTVSRNREGNPWLVASEYGNWLQDSGRLRF
ncbi:MAG: hypothetical protein QOJ80_6114 [Mycobacterium sp.]|jgi:hypothetical protein|nr:hypothetical protein [Mycobacterium sp.]